MACFSTQKMSGNHISSPLLMVVIVVVSLLVLTDAGDPFGFDETTGMSISGREFLLALSTSNPQTGAFIKIHNPSADRRTSVQVTIYGQELPVISNTMVSYKTYKTIRLAPTESGSFVVNVTSTQNITLVAMRNGTSSFGSYTVYPIENAGIFYDIVSFPSASETHQSEITIIAVDDNTSTVTFQSAREFTLHGETADLFSLTIDQNETIYTATGVLKKTQMIVIRSNGDLTGSTVVGTLHGGCVTVISGSYCATGSCDILMEQIPPIQTLGKSYFIVPTKDYQGSNRFRILAPWGNTTVTTGSLQAMMDTNTHQSFILDKSENYDIDLPDGSIQNVQSVQSSNPILLMHYLIKSNNNDVAAMTIIPPVEQFSSGNASFTPYNDTTSSGRPGSVNLVNNFVNIVTICDKKTYLRLNRQQIPTQNWQTCPPFDERDDEDIYCATQTQLTKNVMYTLEPDSRYKDLKYSAVQYGIRTDQSAFANTVFMSFEELTCGVEKDGAVVPCRSDKPATPTLSPTTKPTDDNVLMTSLFNSTFAIDTTVEPSPGNSTHEKSTARRKAGTVLAIVIGAITLIAGIVALALIANAACGKRSKWKRLHNPAGTDNSITLDSVSV